MDIDQPHSLGIDEARVRLRALGDYLATKHGMSVDWLDDNRAHIRGKYKVVTIDAEARVEDHRVHVTGKDPGMLWRIPAKKYVSHKLATYLGPTRPVA